LYIENTETQPPSIAVNRNQPLKQPIQ